MAGYIVIHLLYDNKKSQLKLSVKNIILTLGLVFAFVYLFNNYTELLFNKMQNIESLDDVANTHVDGGSSYGAYAGNSDSIPNLIIYTPIRIVMFLFSPFFWQIRGLADIIAICFDSSFYMFVYYKTIKSIKNKFSLRSFIILIFIYLLN